MSDERKIKWLIYIQLAETNSGHNFTKMIFSFMMFLLNHLSFISTIYNMSGRVVSDIQNDSSYEFIGEVILKINVV